MRRAEKEIKDRGTIEDILRRAKVCRLALSDHNRPYLVPLCFGFRGDRLFFHSAREGKKIDILKENPKVCFEVDLDFQVLQADVPCESSSRYRSVVGFGTAHLLEDAEEKRKALNAIMEHYAERPFEYAEAEVENVAIIEVEIESLTGKQADY
jgi:nitroimidazol reductase NimA-like FMN-containing flavoprotein (pyridoxamine 5'-phosphate oxidase superfamily)